jgi:hypothetical protein
MYENGVAALFRASHRTFHPNRALYRDPRRCDRHGIARSPGRSLVRRSGPGYLLSTRSRQARHEQAAAARADSRSSARSHETLEGTPAYRQSLRGMEWRRRKLCEEWICARRESRRAIHHRRKRHAPYVTAYRGNLVDAAWRGPVAGGRLPRDVGEGAARYPWPSPSRLHEGSSQGDHKAGPQREHTDS